MRIDEKTRLLAGLPIFAVIEPQAVHVLAFSARERRLQAGEQLFRKGEASDGGYIVAGGRIALEADEAGAVRGETFETGSLIGETALISETIRPASAIAVEPTTVLSLSREVVRQVLEAHPASAIRLHRHVARKLAEQTAALSGLA